MKREVPSMLLTTRPPLAALALIVCFSLPLTQLDGEKARSASRKIPKVEIALSSPTTLKRSESLTAQRYKAMVTNRSAEPLVLFVRDGILLNAAWYWGVTDAKGWPVGMEFVPLYGGFCGTPAYSAESLAAWHRLHDSDLFVLSPGESREFPIPLGPSDNYSFPTAGTYYLTVALTYVPPNATEYIDADGKRQPVLTNSSRFYGFDELAGGFERWDLSELSPDAYRALQDSLSVQARSNSWNLVLSSRRRPSGGEAELMPGKSF